MIVPETSLRSCFLHGRLLSSNPRTRYPARASNCRPDDYRGRSRCVPSFREENGENARGAKDQREPSWRLSMIEKRRKKDIADDDVST